MGELSNKMKKNILFLGDNDNKLIQFIKSSDCNVIQTQNKININFLLDNNIDFVVSYGYRYIIDDKVVKFFDKKIINLHISYLPYNRGASPNIWSIVEDTKKGVSIHYVDETLDTGEILIQKQLHFDDNISLKDSYKILKKEIEKLFKLNWNKLVNSKILSQKQSTSGSFHTVNQTNILLKKLNIDGWDITLKDLKKRWSKIK